MARYRLGIYVVVVAISGISTTFIPVSYAGDGPNRVTSSDLAAGNDPVAGSRSDARVRGTIANE